MGAGLGTSVSRADLRPGGLVFFHDPIGHNGI
jgi:cell wall-associated NlpC family hydrolase